MSHEVAKESVAALRLFGINRMRHWMAPDFRGKADPPFRHNRNMKAKKSLKREDRSGKSKHGPARPAPVPKKIGEEEENLRRRGEWFRRRSTG
jgi:hypothetical protein